MFLSLSLRGVARHEAKQSADCLRSFTEIVPHSSSLRGTKQSVDCFRSSPEITFVLYLIPSLISSLRGVARHEAKQSVDCLRSSHRITLLQASQGHAYPSKRHDIFYLIIQIRPVGIDTID